MRIYAFTGKQSWSAAVVVEALLLWRRLAVVVSGRCKGRERERERREREGRRKGNCLSCASCVHMSSNSPHIIKQDPICYCYTSFNKGMNDLDI